jgi:hypothetical protein
MTLAPLPEVRKVAFAARYIQETENFYTPVDVVTVKFIPRFSEYTSAERRNVWYTNVEIKLMKQRALRDVDRRREENKFNANKPQRQQIRYSCDIRGLERLVYSDSNECARIRYESLHALQQEQYQHQCWIYGINNPGGIVHLGDDYLNDERIRQVVMAKGQSILSQEIAYRLAKQDEVEADEYMELIAVVFESSSSTTTNEDNRDDKNTTATPCASWQQPRQSYSEKMVSSPMIGRKNRRPGTKPSNSSSNKSECCWCVDVVDKVGRSLLLNAMLAPFLSLQRGDALLVD